jgi:NAD(P)-dependent dehydrogenase (short-subunit alcohol dehydrogenase family)
LIAAAGRVRNLTVDVSSQIKVALITGSGRRRVGNVVARALAERGYAIGLHYRTSAESAQATLAELRARHRLPRFSG